MPDDPVNVALEEDMEEDFLSVDHLEPVTYQVLNEDGATTQTIQVSKALWRSEEEDVQVRERLISSAQFLISGGNVLTCHIPRRSLGDVTPNKGHRVIDKDGVAWIVWIVKLQTFRTRWRLTCIQEEGRDQADL